MIARFLTGAAVALALATAGQATLAAPWKIDNKHAFVHFSAVHLGILPYHGRFKKFRIALDYDPDNVERSSVDVRVPIKSVETDDGLMNQTLTGDQFFDVRNFPEMRFKSTAIRRTGPDTGVIEGELTMKGNTRPVAFSARFNGEAKHPFTGAPVIGIEAVAKINRREWGLSAWRGFVSDEVTIRIGFEASPE